MGVELFYWDLSLLQMVNGALSASQVFNGALSSSLHY